MMRITIIICLMIYFSLMGNGCYAQNQRAIDSDEWPQQEVNDVYTWDFGAVKEGRVVKHDFIFKNETKNVLNIQGLNNSCGCTVSEIKKKSLMPQEETIIEVQLKTKGYSGDIKQFVYVNTDNIEEPVTRLVIKANVVK
ncbi:MAG: DUF1573 domain-containing protein [Candidatus Omnitrophota bacterium]